MLLLVLSEQYLFTHDIHSMLDSLCILTGMAVGTRHSTSKYSITIYYLTGAFTRDYGLLVASAPPIFIVDTFGRTSIV